MRNLLGDREPTALIGSSVLIILFAVVALVTGGSPTTAEDGDGERSEIVAAPERSGSSSIGASTTPQPRSSSTDAPTASGASHLPGSTQGSSVDTPSSDGGGDSGDSDGDSPTLPLPNLPIDPTDPVDDVVEVLCTVQERAAIDDAVSDLGDDLLAQKNSLLAQIADLEAQIDTLLGGSDLDELLNGLLGILNPTLKTTVEGLLGQIDTLEAELAAVQAEIDALPTHLHLMAPVPGRYAAARFWANRQPSRSISM